MLTTGASLSARQLHHLCEHRHCVNPAHLEVVTGAEHSARDGNAAKTHCRHGHALTEDNVYRTRSGRRCRICGREAQRKSYAKRKRKRRRRRG